MRTVGQELDDLVVVGGPQGDKIRPDEVASVKDLLALDDSTSPESSVMSDASAVLKITKTKPQDARSDSGIEEQLADQGSR